MPQAGVISFHMMKLSTHSCCAIFPRAEARNGTAVIQTQTHLTQSPNLSISTAYLPHSALVIVGSNIILFLK